MLKRFLILTAAVLAIAARPAAASSITVNGNTSFTVNWLNTVTNPDLSGSALFTISDWTGSTFKMTISVITNSTPTTPDISARFVSFGFGLSPDEMSTSNKVDGSVFKWAFDTNFPSFGTMDVCAYSGPNCSGGGGGGLTAGQTMPGSMSIVFNGNFGEGVTFSPFAAKFQTGAGSYEFDGCIGPCTTRELDPPPSVPEPASLVLFGSGLALAAAKLRRKTVKV